MSRASTEPSSDSSWGVGDAGVLYGVGDWSEGLFGIDGGGRALVRRAGDPGTGVALAEIVDALRAQGVHPPVLLRFSDVLEERIGELHRAFDDAMGEHGYTGGYEGVYPIKVNQQRHMVNAVRRAGAGLGFGLEVGSKPELLMALGMALGEPLERQRERLILCNGFKDRAYAELVALGTAMGLRVIATLENLDELDTILAVSEEFGVEIQLGARVKMASGGKGRWAGSAGAGSKFGLHASELLVMVERLRAQGMLERLRLVHGHLGSQVQDIGRLGDAVAELAYIYTELSALGAAVRWLDVGGGLGVDYLGMREDAPSSMNYSPQEYASAVVHRIGQVCAARSAPEPVIVTECGRAMTAHASVLVFDVVGSTGPGSALARVGRASGRGDGGGGGSHPSVEDLRGCVRELGGLTEDDGVLALVTVFHQARAAFEASMDAFRLGYLGLEARGEAERLYWETLGGLIGARGAWGDPDGELEELDGLGSDVYFANMSVFQSLPDAWAIDQVFPIMPLTRLDERPDHLAVLGDVTCDSDGRIDRFAGATGETGLLPVHALDGGNYALGVFLVGAYQETLGDLHNLFGDVHAVHIRLDPEAAGGWVIEEVVEGDTCEEVLSYIQHEVGSYTRAVRAACEAAAARGELTREAAARLSAVYKRVVGEETYLMPWDRS